MASYRSVKYGGSPAVFRLSDDSPTPLHNPDTSYLTSTPELPTAPPTTSTQDWQPLQVTPRRSPRSPLSPNIYVPGPPTPRTPRLHNNTPTSVASTTGSWVERRRQGQVVDRPLDVPKVRVTLPDSSEGYTPDTELDRRIVSRATTAADSQESVTSKPLSRQVCQDGQQEVDPAAASIQVPEAAKVASRPIQLDGAREESEETKHVSRRRTCCEKLYGSFRKIPSMLSLRDKSVLQNDKNENNKPSNAREARQARPLDATHDKNNWLSNTSLRFKKRAANGRKHRHSVRGSLRGLFSNTNSSNGVSAHSEDHTLLNQTRFDDNRNPPSFVGPTLEGDSNSPVGEPFAHITAAEIAQEYELGQEQTPRQDCILN